jgi:hypothetical protein
MLWPQRFWLRLQTLLRRERAARRLDDEVQFHLEQQIAENIAAGMNPQEARCAAMRTFGNSTFLKEETRDTWGWIWLEQIAQDFRYAARMLRKSPGFTAAVVLTLALGIGANTAIFTMTNGLMLRTLPIKDPRQLVELLQHAPGDPEPGFNSFSWDAYRIMRDGNHVFSDLFIASTMNFFPVRADKLQPQTVFGGSVGT